MSFTVVIPARYASTRLPGKPLLDIVGQTMIERVYHCAEASRAARVVVATDDSRIAKAVGEFGGEAVLTRADHTSGTDRLQEVASQLGLDDEAIVVNVQGDEPLMPAAVINQVADNLDAHPQACCATLAEPLTGPEQVFNTNIVKVVADNLGMALYFSRASIPWDRDNYRTGDGFGTDVVPELARRHIGLYAYRAGLLHDFVAWSEAPLERLEKLEQLRILANGRKIHVATACEPVPGGVDTPVDLERIRTQLAEK